MKKIHLSLTFPIFLSIISYEEFMFLSLTKYCWLDSHLFNCLSVDMIYSSIQQLILTRLMILLFEIFLKLLSYKLDEKDKATQSITSVHVFIAIKVIKLSKRPCSFIEADLTSCREFSMMFRFLLSSIEVDLF